MAQQLPLLAVHQAVIVHACLGSKALSQALPEGSWVSPLGRPPAAAANWEQRGSAAAARLLQQFLKVARHPGALPSRRLRQLLRNLQAAGVAQRCVSGQGSARTYTAALLVWPTKSLEAAEGQAPPLTSLACPRRTLGKQLQPLPPAAAPTGAAAAACGSRLSSC